MVVFVFWCCRRCATAAANGGSAGEKRCGYDDRVPVFAIGLTHADVETDQLAALTKCGDGLADRLVADDSGLIIGAITLATCNRFEVYVHATTFHRAVKIVRRELAETATGATLDTIDAMKVHNAHAAVEHLFEVASGLDSMVVGEKEIAGQVKDALKCAGSNVSARLRRLFQAAATTSKKVVTDTDLGAAGRSVATVGLDLVEQRHGDYAGRKVLIVGTGAFARVAVAELRRRGVVDMQVYSSTGRAEQFAQSHQLEPVGRDELDQALAWADAIVCCSGSHAKRISTELLRESRAGLGGVLPILDLSLEGDVEPDVEDLSTVAVIGLDEIGKHAPPEQTSAVQAANEIVQESVAKYLEVEQGRHADPTVMVMRQHFQSVIEAEIDMVTARYPADTAKAVAEALRRVSNELLHTPTVRAAQMARQGELASYQQALATVFGLEVAAMS